MTEKHAKQVYVITNIESDYQNKLLAFKLKSITFLQKGK